MVTVDLRERYCPHGGQLPFHVDGGSVRFRLLSGGTGSGKTLAGMAEDVYWALQYPGIVGYVFEPTYGMIERNVVPTLDRLLGVPFWECPAVEDFNRSRMCVTFFNGSKMWFVSLDRPEQAEGANVDFAHVDEARLVKPDDQWEVAWRVIQRRLRGSGMGDYPVGAWVTTTPNLPGSALYKFFEDPRTRNPDSKVYRMHLDDNVYLREDYREDVKRAHSVSESLYKRFVEGIFAADDVAYFPFDYTVHVQKYEKPLTSYVAYGVDFGWSEPTAIVVILFDGDKRAFVVDEVYGTRMSSAEILNNCARLQDKWGEGAFWCDPSAPDTIDFLRRGGIRAEKGNRNRDEGLREIASRMKDAGDGRRRLYISNGCVNTIDEFQGFTDEKGGRDHAVDATRYCLMGGAEGIRERNFEFGPAPGYAWVR